MVEQAARCGSPVMRHSAIGKAQRPAVATARPFREMPCRRACERALRHEDEGLDRAAVAATRGDGHGRVVAALEGAETRRRNRIDALDQTPLDAPPALTPQHRIDEIAPPAAPPALER